MTRSLIALLAAAACIAISCGESREPAKVTETPSRRELTIAAAASLKESFTELAGMLEEEQHGLDVVLTFGASNLLARQIAGGAPVDLFASASKGIVDSIAGLGMIDTASRVTFASNRLVVAGPKGAGPMEGMSAGAWRGFRRIAVAGPGVPARIYAEEALRAAGLWEELQPRLVFGANVRQVLDYVASGDADAGLVYTTDAAAMADRVAVILTIPDSLHKKISYPAAIVSNARNRADAERFLALTTGPRGRAVLRRYGFEVAGGR